jgi:hypothetical protein
LIKEFLCSITGKYALILNFIPMQWSKKALWAVVLLVICLTIKWFSSNSYRVENLYSNHFFPGLAGLLRRSWGGLGFSVGDILYGIVAAWLIWKTIRLLFFMGRKKQNGELSYKARKNIYSIFVIGCVFYIIFNLFWGINYNRKGIAWQLNLTEMKYSTEDLKEMNCMLIDKINEAKRNLVINNRTYYSNKELFVGVKNAYGLLGKQYPFLKYDSPSIKSSMWGWLGNYAGFTGYYNPFTGEAQVNTTVPKFLQPFTTCHEVAHQLGYAKEKEANFVGYLAAAASRDTIFEYSIYLDLFTYANRNLYLTDSLQARVYRKELIDPVKTDIREWILFNQKHRSFLEPVFRWLYGKFLQSNEQPQGLLSYDEVTGFLIAYYKKYGKI